MATTAKPKKATVSVHGTKIGVLTDATQHGQTNDAWRAFRAANPHLAASRSQVYRWVARARAIYEPSGPAPSASTRTGMTHPAH